MSPHRLQRPAHEADGDAAERLLERSRPSTWIPRVSDLFVAASVVGAATAVSLGIDPWVTHSDQVMVFMLSVVIAAYRASFKAAIVSAVLSIAAFDFFFVPPFYTFAVESTHYVLTFVVMGSLSIVVSGLVWRVRVEAAFATAQQRATERLLDLTRHLAASENIAEIAEVAARDLARAFACSVTVFLGGDGELALEASHGDPLPVPDATDVWDEIEDALDTSSPTPTSEVVYLALRSGASAPLGVVGLRLTAEGLGGRPNRIHLLQTMTTQVSHAIERARLAEAAREAHVGLESERLRNSLLSSISHDLRTPVASIVGATEVLLDPTTLLRDARSRELISGAYEEAIRLSRLLDNLLDMTRIEGGGLTLTSQWLVPEETVGAVLRRLQPVIGGHQIATRVEVELGLYDEPSVETALLNLVENAARYSPAGSTVTVRCHSGPSDLIFEVIDEGLSFDPGEAEQLFQKFYRGSNAAHVTGSGMGLAIVDAVARAHGGAAFAQRRDDTPGAVFGFRIPQSVAVPSVPEAQ